MSAKLLVYLDYLLKNSAVPMMLKLDPEKLSPDEILEINKMVADGDLRVNNDTGDMFIASREVYDKWQDVIYKHYVDFKPDLEKCKGGWVVNYDYCAGIFSCTHIYSTSRGEPVYYATKEEAEKSIRENERDWKIFFGIKEEE